LAEVIGSPDVIVTAAAAAAAADVFAVGTSNGCVFLFDRCGPPPSSSPHSSLPLRCPFSFPPPEPFFRSDSLVFLHAFHDLDSAVSGIVLSRDGCDMRVRACAAVLFSRPVLTVFRQVFTISGHAFSLHLKEAAVAAKDAASHPPLIDLSDL
jgi:hypothetical protein